MFVVQNHEQSVNAVWEESALWVEAWQHAWPRNALKQHTWVQQILQHYRAKQEALWVRAREDVRDGVKKNGKEQTRDVGTICLARLCTNALKISIARLMPGGKQPLDSNTPVWSYILGQIWLILLVLDLNITPGDTSQCQLHHQNNAVSSPQHHVHYSAITQCQSSEPTRASTPCIGPENVFCLHHLIVTSSPPLLATPIAGNICLDNHALLPYK